MSSTPTSPGPRTTQTKPHRDRTHWLYIMVVVAVIAGVIVGLVSPELGKTLKPLGEWFISLIKMMIAPVIFCTIVMGIGSIKAAATIGKAGSIALIYFITMSTFALAIGLFVGNLVQPGDGIVIVPGKADKYVEQAAGSGGLSIIPTTLVSALSSPSVLQTLFVALLVGFALQGMGRAGEPLVALIGQLKQLVFRVLAMILWVAPIGAFGAIAGVVADSGAAAVGEILKLMFAFYVTCFLFVFGVLGSVLWFFTRVNIFLLFKYLAREFLLIVSTSSSESALPNLIAKMEHLGVDRSTVGIVVPTGYSFNLDGTAIYLTMASIFVADAMHKPLTLGEQIGLLLFMMIASKGAAGVTGAGLATLAGGLQAHRPELVDGVGVIVGIDRFMSEARALTNFAGNSVATVLIGTWTRSIDRPQVDRVLAGGDPFDYTTMSEDEEVDAVTAGVQPTATRPEALSAHPVEDDPRGPVR